MADATETIIKREQLGSSLRRVSFRDLVDRKGFIKGEHFVRLKSDGMVPAPKVVPKEPEISQEELNQRRQEQIEREIYQKVFKAAEKSGLEMGEQKMEREINRLLPQFETILRHLDTLPARIIADTERFLVETALLITRGLLGHELSVNPQGVEHRVKRILKHTVGRKDIVISVSPGNVELLQRLDRFKNLRIEADPELAPGSVRMQSDFGGIEDNLESQLQQVEEGIRHYLQDRLRQVGVEDIASAAASKFEKFKKNPPVPLAKDFSPTEDDSSRRESFDAQESDVQESSAQSDAQESFAQGSDVQESSAQSDVQESFAQGSDIQESSAQSDVQESELPVRSDPEVSAPLEDQRNLLDQLGSTSFISPEEHADLSGERDSTSFISPEEHADLSGKTGPRVFISPEEHADLDMLNATDSDFLPENFSLLQQDSLLDPDFLEEPSALDDFSNVVPAFSSGDESDFELDDFSNVVPAFPSRDESDSES